MAELQIKPIQESLSDGNERLCSDHSGRAVPQSFQLYQLYFSKGTGYSKKSEHCWEEKDRPIFNYLAITLSAGVDLEACALWT